MDINEAFGKALREVRLSKGISQEKMASAASRVYISALERGLKNPTLNAIERIADQLEIHPLVLLLRAYAHCEGMDLKSLTESLQKYIDLDEVK